MKPQIYPSPQSLARQFAGIFAQWVALQLQTKSYLYIALSGGSTPQLWFTELAGNFAGKIEWSRLHFFWVDERYVPHSHPESNYGVAYRLLFNHVNTPKGNLHPIPVTADIIADVRVYTAEIVQYVAAKDGWPVFDLITLGMGPDGHTASIFPGQLALFNNNEPVCASQNPHTAQQRITLTGQLINRAAVIYFLVTGKEKAPLVRDIFDGTDNAKNYPAAYIRGENTIWLMDEEAAKLVTKYK